MLNSRKTSRELGNSRDALEPSKSSEKPSRKLSSPDPRNIEIFDSKMLIVNNDETST